MNLEHAFADYERHLAARNYAPATVANYGRLLGRLRVFLQGLGVSDVSQVTKGMMGDFQQAERERENGLGRVVTVHTANHHLFMAKNFFRYLREEGVLWCDPTREVTMAKEPQSLPRTFLTAAEAKRIMEAADASTAQGYRDRAILEVLYSTGIRKGELNNLKVTDVDLEGGFLRVNQGKGGKDRVVPLGKTACRYVEGYMAGIRPQFLGNDRANPYLFLSNRGNRMSPMVARKVVGKYATLARITKKVTPHTFRHTCATLMLKNRANIRHVQELLGHASLETTKVYTAVTVTDLKEIHRRCHPRERDRKT